MAELADTHLAIAQIIRDSGKPRDALAHCLASLDYRNRLIESRATSPETEIDRCQTLRQMGLIHFSMGNLEEAVTVLQAGVDSLELLVSENPGNENAISAYADLLSQSGWALREKGQSDQAEMRLQLAFELGSGLAERNPDSLARQRKLNEYRHLLAVVLKSTGKMEEAEQLAVANVAAARRIVDHADSNFGDQDKLSKSLFARALHQLMRGEFSEAAPSLQEATGIQSGLASVFPDTTVYFSMWAQFANASAIALAESGELDAALVQFEAAETALESMVKLDATAIDARIELASAKINYGSVLAEKTDRLEEAGERLLAAREILSSDLKTSPESVTAVRGLISCDVNLASLANSRRRFQEAIEYSDSALNQLDELMQQQPSEPQWRYLRSQALGARATGEHELGLFHESVESWRDFIDFCPPPEQPVAQLKLAAALAGAGELVEAIELVSPLINEEFSDAEQAFQMGRASSRIFSQLTMKSEGELTELAEQLGMDPQAESGGQRLDPEFWQVRAMVVLQAANELGFFDRPSRIALLESADFDAVKTSDLVEKLLSH